MRRMRPRWRERKSACHLRHCLFAHDPDQTPVRANHILQAILSRIPLLIGSAPEQRHLAVESTRGKRPMEEVGTPSPPWATGSVGGSLCRPLQRVSPQLASNTFESWCKAKSKGRRGARFHWLPHREQRKVSPVPHEHWTSRNCFLRTTPRCSPRAT